MADDDDNAAKQCRFCLDGALDGDFVAPCECRGGQRWVHLTCLRRWQRSILVTQPTHPALIEDDRRITHCQVCLARLSCPLLSRHEMMLQFTGAELASLVREQSLISSSESWSDALYTRLRQSSDRRSISNFVHWSRSSYFIYYCGPKQLALSIPDERNREAVLDNIDSAGRLEIHGRQYRLVLEGSLAHLRGPGTDPESASTEIQPTVPIYHALNVLRLPTEVTLQQVDSDDRSDDSIRAVNLTKRISNEDLSWEVRANLRRACQAAKFPRDALHASAKIEHFLGGPCAASQCVVMAPATFASQLPGFKMFEDLQVAIGTDLATALRALREFDEVVKGDSDRTCESPPKKRRKVEADLANDDESDVSEWGVSVGEFASEGPPDASLASQSEEELPEVDVDAADMVVSIAAESILQVARVQDAQPASPKTSGEGAVLGEASETTGHAGWLRIFWGEARWQRTQLLGELARGDWGLCQAREEDLNCKKHFWHSLHEQHRPVFAPRNEMTRASLES